MAIGISSAAAFAAAAGPVFLPTVLKQCVPSHRRTLTGVWCPRHLSLGHVKTTTELRRAASSTGCKTGGERKGKTKESKAVPVMRWRRQPPTMARSRIAHSPRRIVVVGAATIIIIRAAAIIATIGRHGDPALRVSRVEAWFVYFRRCMPKCVSLRQQGRRRRRRRRRWW